MSVVCPISVNFFYWSIVHHSLNIPKFIYSFIYWITILFSCFEPWSLNLQCIFWHRSFCLYIYFLIQVNNCLDKEFRGYKVVLYWNLKDTLWESSKWLYHFISSQAIARECKLLHIFFNSLFHLSLLIEHLGTSHFFFVCFNFHYSNDKWQWATFLILVYHSYSLIF